MLTDEYAANEAVKNMDGKRILSTNIRTEISRRGRREKSVSLNRKSSNFIIDEYRLTIDGLPRNIDWKDLKDLIRNETSCEVKYVNIYSNGDAIADFHDFKDMNNAINILNDLYYKGNRLKVSERNHQNLQNQSQRKDTDQTRTPNREQIRDQFRDQNRDQNREQNRDQNRERTHSRSRSRTRSRSRERRYSFSITSHEKLRNEQSRYQNDDNYSTVGVALTRQSYSGAIYKLIPCFKYLIKRNCVRRLL